MLGDCLAFHLQRSQALLNLKGSFEHSKKLLLPDVCQISCNHTAFCLHCYAFPGTVIKQLSPSRLINGLKSQHQDWVGS